MTRKPSRWDEIKADLECAEYNCAVEIGRYISQRPPMSQAEIADHLMYPLATILMVMGKHGDWFHETGDGWSVTASFEGVSPKYRARG